MQTDLTSIEAIGLAVRSEEDAAKFYAHVSKLIANPVIREKYENLAKEEIQHGQVLTGLYKKMTGDTARPPRIPGSPVTAEGGAIPTQIAGSLEDLLKLAVTRESDAKDFYNKAARESIDPSGKRILAYLASVESGHEEMLKKELEAYLNDRGLYESADLLEMIHVGP
ncbi:MAG: ferritin family protein [Deltaproteobacteria bacterium]|nr:ferritin family protein [Deltaproteobacteria bacterium]